jgi:hypothetical protein
VSSPRPRDRTQTKDAAAHTPGVSAHRIAALVGVVLFGAFAVLLARSYDPLSGDAQLPLTTLRLHLGSTAEGPAGTPAHDVEPAVDHNGSD